MTNCQITLLKLLSKGLFNRDIVLISIDENELLKEAKSQAVVHLVYNALDKDNMSEEADKEWKKSVMTFLMNDIQITHHHAMLHDWMSSAGIPYVILKGCASANYYSKPVERAMGDVDFLVPPDKLD